MAVHDDAWLAHVLERQVFRVETGTDPSQLQRDVAAHIALQRAPAFYFAKVDTSDVAVVKGLSAEGFYVVDVNVTLEVARPAPPSRETRDVAVATVKPDDSAAVLDIAGTAFRYSRFHLDPQIQPADAHRIKREWMANYVNGSRGEALLVAHLDGRVAGFLAVIGSGSADRRVRAIDLVAVDTAAQGRGVGSALVQAFIDRYAASSERLLVGTQVANAPSLRLYHRLGFQIHRSAYVMHFHSPSGEGLKS
jgi:ribosomal protein S18 acetylase RimI-like enzyme